MGILSYLPSAQFTLVVVSIAISGSLVFAADRLTQEEGGGQLTTAQTPQNQEIADWQSTLEEIQAQSGASLPPPPPKEAYETLLAAAQESPNVTQSAARTLFINLSNASAQGLGSDIPTQDRLIAETLAHMDAAASASAYTSAELVLVENSPDTLRLWGNALMQTLQNHPKASVNDALLAVGYAVEQDDKTHFDTLAPIGAAYGALVRDLLLIPVPNTMVPLHLAVVNSFSRITQTFIDMRAMPTDPLRGLGGLHSFHALTGEVRRVFTTIAQQLQQNAIIFNEDEPGSAWSAFLSV